MKNETQEFKTTPVVPTDGTVKEVTGFQFHKIVNARLEKDGIMTLDKKTNKMVQKRIPPQMIYNYTTGRINKGKTPFIPLNDHGFIDMKVGLEWLEKYLTKLVARTSK